MIPQPLWWVVIQHEHTHRDTFIGPFHTHEQAIVSMENSNYVQGLCEEDCIDCFTSDVQPDQDVHEVIIINPFDPHFTGEGEDPDTPDGLYVRLEPVRNNGHDTLGACGCRDYHLSDCPTRVSDISPDPGDLTDRWYS